MKEIALFELAKPVAPGEATELKIDWSISGAPVKEGEKEATWAWYPRLDWGFGTLDDYEIRLDSLPDLSTDLTGRFEAGVLSCDRCAARRAFRRQGISALNG